MSEPLNIRLRRQDEDRREGWRQAVSEAHRATVLNRFENRAQAKLHGRLAREHVAAQNKVVRDQVDERRRRLAALLEEERRGFEAEIKASFETPEQVKARSFAYARQLRDEREAARKRLVGELEERRFRLQSDVLRQRQSQVTAERVALDRLSQLEDKRRIAEAEAAEKTAALEALEREQARHADRARVEAEARRRLVEETRVMLEGQVAARTQLTAAELAHRAAVEAAELDEVKVALAARRDAEARRRVEARDEYLRLQESNRADLSARRAVAEAEKAADAAHLRDVLARDAEAAARDGDAAARRKAETLANRAQLEAQMGLQAEETAWMDRHFAEEQEREWARRQAKWDAEAAARRALQADVTTVRGHQVQDRARARAEEEARDAAQVAVWREQQAAAAAREAAAAAERRRAIELQKSYTAKQLAENEAARAAAAQAAYLESRLAEKVERGYHARVEALLKEPLPESTLHARKRTGLW